MKDFYVKAKRIMSEQCRIHCAAKTLLLKACIKIERKFRQRSFGNAQLRTLFLHHNQLNLDLD